MGTVGKEARAWRWPLTSSSAEVKVRVELYLFSPSGPSRPLLGRTLPLLLPLYTEWTLRNSTLSAYLAMLTIGHFYNRELSQHRT